MRRATSMAMLPGGGCPLGSGDVWVLNPGFSRARTRTLGWSFHGLSGPSLKCSLRPGTSVPQPGRTQRRVWSFLPGVPQLGPPSTQGLSPQSLPFKPCTLCLSAPSPAHLTSGAAGAGSHRPRHWAGALVTAGPSSHPTQGRFTIAAKHHVSIAEIYETELVDIEKVSGSRALPGCSSQSCGTGTPPSVVSSRV